MKIKVLTSLCAFFISGVALAECPSGLNAEKMADCITIQVASSDQDWQKNEYPVNLNASTKTSSEVRTDISTEEPECD